MSPTARLIHVYLELFNFELKCCVFQEHHTNQPNQTGLHGIHLRAFCTGLDSMLQPYRQALLDLEQEVRSPHSQRLRLA